MKTIRSTDSDIYFGNESHLRLNEYIARSNVSKVFVIVDTNTRQHCLPLFLSEAKIGHDQLEVLEFAPGEEHKNIDTCQQIWQALSDLGADRKCLIVNLGGGVVTDLGGFVACTYKRGVDYINVPTSLLSMVDASLGGKTGIDLGPLKNQIGVISNGKMVLIDVRYLQTLPEEQIRSGWAEMLKHGLIANRNYWNRLKNSIDVKLEDLEELILKSVQIKNVIVAEDPHENNLRKALNFGHTLGHAIESYHLKTRQKQSLLHGEAIAIGMVLESYLSHQLNNLAESDLKDIQQHIGAHYPKVSFDDKDIEEIIRLLKHDKKNSHGKVKFALLKELGVPMIDCLADDHLIKEAFQFYKESL